MTNYIQTYSGRKIDFDNPHSSQIDILDIARALSHTPRFSGHTERFYSVAAHSMCVAELVPEEFKLVALLHDAPEAYLTDMPTPFKERLPDYRALELRVWVAVAAKFGLPLELPAEVKRADRMCLMKEADALKPNRTAWADEYESHPRAPHILAAYPMDHICTLFLRAFERYGGTT